MHVKIQAHPENQWIQDSWKWHIGARFYDYAYTLRIAFKDLKV